jgi:2-iminobutanoate/2-iminopropanoate deaminase
MQKNVFAAPDGAPAVFLSGQIPLDHEGRIVGFTPKDQTRKALENMRVTLAAAGLRMDDVVKTTIFLKDMDDFAAVNEVYAEFFAEPYPARSTVQVARLPKDVRVEIEAVAVR